MTYKLQLIATGMVTFRPAVVVHPNTIPQLTFVMMDNPTRRQSVNAPEREIPKHVGFLLAPDANILRYDAWRPPDLAANPFGYAGWLLDKERLSLEGVPPSGISFDSSIGEIANIAAIDPALRMEPRYAEINPPKLEPVAAQFVVEAGSVWAEGRRTRVRFHTATGTPGPEMFIRNEVYVEIELSTALFTIRSHALDGGNPLSRMRFQFTNGQQRMKIYFGSAPPPVLQQVPSGTASLGHPQDIDFELYYDITKGGPPSQRPIPHRQDSGPVPGSERCPPLQNM